MQSLVFVTTGLFLAFFLCRVFARSQAVLDFIAPTPFPRSAASNLWLLGMYATFLGLLGPLLNMPHAEQYDGLEGPAVTLMYWLVLSPALFSLPLVHRHLTPAIRVYWYLLGLLTVWHLAAPSLDEHWVVLAASAMALMPVCLVLSLIRHAVEWIGYVDIRLLGVGNRMALLRWVALGRGEPQRLAGIFEELRFQGQCQPPPAVLETAAWRALFLSN